MKPMNFPLNAVARICATGVLCGSLAAVSPQLFAATAAGTEIKNLATVTYEDAAGNTFSAQSNEAVVTVAQVYAATIGTDVDVTASPGQTVYLPYVLTNTGNGTDIFEVSAADGITGGDTLDAGNISVFRDTNGNGIADPGEPELTTVSLAADEKTDIVVAVQIPTTATATDTVGVTLTATAQEGTGAAVAASVTDLTAGSGQDGTDGTVESLITVTNDAVLAMTKTSSNNTAANEITYTVTVTNNGNTAAQNVVLFDGLPEGTAFVSASVSGLLTTNGDTLATSVAVLDESIGFDLNADGDQADVLEAGIGLDLNTDGDTADSGLPGVYAVDAELAPNATVSMTITVSYDPVTFGGGTSINNVAYLSADTDGDNIPDTIESSNLTSDDVVQDFAVLVTDTGIGAAPGTNDGGDDDGAGNGIQTVDSAASGGTVLFDFIVENTGNADDSFELSIDPGTFPAGTIFTFLNEAGSVQLTDTNGIGGVDTGVIAQAGTRTMQVSAKLPQGISGDNTGAGYTATINATSAEDPNTAAPATSSADILLQNIVTSSADIHEIADGNLGTDESPLGAAPFIPVDTVEADAGATVNVPVFIDNESGVSDSYQLFAGSSFDGANVGALPDGWSVQFFLDDGTGQPTGPAITSTPSIPGDTVDFAVIAVVTLPADTTLAEADVLFDANGDGTATLTDENGDGDGDYPLFLQIISANSGATDTFLEAIDVNAGRAVAFTPSSSNQVEAGGTVDYPVTLRNTGNSEETLELTVANSQPGFNNAVTIDTDGDGAPDTVLGNLVPGPINVQLQDGTVVTINVEDADADSNPELVLPPGIDLPLLATVLAPSTAAPGQVDVLTLDAINVDPAADAPDSSVSFQTDVINGQVRLTKTVAVDLDCDGAADTPFLIAQTTEVEPNQCAIWRVIAENQGDVDALNVKISDSVTAFSTLEPNSLAYCITNACLPAAVTDISADDEGEVVGTGIVFFVGIGANPGTNEGGTLIPGQQATAQFSVRVD